MEKREPSLVPEWLRNSGHGSGGGSVNQPSSRSDSSSLSHNSKSRNSRSNNDFDSDRSSSTNTRRGFSNGYTKHAYSSFNVNRSQRDKDRSRENDRGLSYLDPWDDDTSIPLGNFLSGRDHEQLRRSHPMVARKQGNNLTRGLKNGGSMNISNGNGMHPGTSPVKNTRKPGFDKDFPLLKGEDRDGVTNNVRISSPSKSPAVQSLSDGNFGEGWTSALAEAPNVIEKSGRGSHANVGSSAALTGLTSRNMAEALVQAPTRTGSPPQGSVQRFEDRAIKQSRQLIPVVPSALKGSVLHSSDKSKMKPVVRNAENGLASLRNTQQQSSVLLGNQIKLDSNKKLLILKPTRENGVGSGDSPPNSRAANNQMTAAPSNGPRECKGEAGVHMIIGKTAEKKLSLAQTQSRNAFYSALKQKTSTNISTGSSKTNSCVTSSMEEKANCYMEIVANNDISSAQEAVEREEIIKRVEKVSEVAEKINGFVSADRPDEKEAKFLKSLGWDENYTEEEEALTEEEIRAFIEQCKKSKPSLLPKLPIMQEATKDVAPSS